MDGRITFKYGKLGELNENIRTFALPFEIMMNRRRTYRPQPAQISADSLRGDLCDTRDPRRFPRDPRRHSPPAHPILNSSFLILNWSYTFSAKEKDPETGLSYFGSRYYSSDLSIWLNVDPMSGKYPHQANYAYCSNNPIKVVDPDGEDEWEVNQSGYIRHIENNKPDRLYAVCGFGEEGWGKRKTNVEPLDVDKSIMETMSNSGKYTTFSAQNNGTKMDVFKKWRSQ